MTDPLLILIEALEQQQPHAPISRKQVAEALRLILARLEVNSLPTEPQPEDADLQEVLPHLI
jgi:hypothetical protein